MKHAKIFAGVMGIILSGGAANAAFPADTATYPTYRVDQQTADTNGDNTAENFAEGTIKDKNIKLATTKYLDAQADTANQRVQELSSSANQTNQTVTANTTAIETMDSNRQVVTGNECDNLESQYIACGYIVPEGTTTTNAVDANNQPDASVIHDSSKYQWVKIIATVDAVTAANASSSGSSGA